MQAKRQLFSTERRYRAKFLLLALAAILFAGPVLAEPPPHPVNRAEAVDVVRGLRRIVTPDGIDRAEAVKIGGIEQWVTIRGDHRANPVLLVLHGGPGYVEMPLSWWYDRGWEEYFTVVEWDQRGAGTTYLLNDPVLVGPTMKPERFIQDAEEMTSWLRATLKQPKIFVWGHSWGSYLGLELARRHPDWLYAYIGTGQVTNSPESERRAWQFALAAAKAANNTLAIAALQALGPYPRAHGASPLASVMTVHRWTDFYGGLMAYRHNQEDESHAGRLSPDYTDAQAPHIFDGNGYSEGYLLADLLSLDLSQNIKLGCPLILLEGRHDRVTNADVAHDWFDRVQAPEKHFIWFDDSGHEPEFEEPGRFLLALIHYAWPIARAGGGEP